MIYQCQIYAGNDMTTNVNVLKISSPLAHENYIAVLRFTLYYRGKFQNDVENHTGRKGEDIENNYQEIIIKKFFKLIMVNCTIFLFQQRFQNILF